MENKMICLDGSHVILRDKYVGLSKPIMQRLLNAIGRLLKSPPGQKKLAGCYMLLLLGFHLEKTLLHMVVRER